MLFVVALLTTGVAFAQSAAEFGRASGGQLDLTLKAPSRFSGSFGLTTGRSTFGTFGGTVVKDRVWFFASGERTRPVPQTDRGPVSTRPFLSLKAAH